MTERVGDEAPVAGGAMRRPHQARPTIRDVARLADVSVGTVEATLTYAWVDERYTAPNAIPSAEPGAWLEDFGIVNASINWSDIFDTRLDLQLFGTNLTDEEYRVNNSNVWSELAYRNSIWSEPRMYGLKVTYRWGDQ